MNRGRDPEAVITMAGREASLREQGWPLALIDAGGLSKRFGQQALLKFRTSVEAMTEMFERSRVGDRIAQERLYVIALGTRKA